MAGDELHDVGLKVLHADMHTPLQLEVRAVR